MDDRQKRALGALASMAKQYLEKRPDNLLDSDAMGAGERAISALAGVWLYGRSRCWPYIWTLDRSW